MKYVRTIEIELEIDDELLDVLNEQYYDACEENISNAEDLESLLNEYTDDEIMYEFENSSKKVTQELVEIDEEMLEKMYKIED